jgi:hypothetical protein
MRSEARIELGCRSGMFANGTKSIEARQKWAQNSPKHGLFSKSLVPANESPEYFEFSRKSCHGVWKPENQFEADLVNDVVAARWRLNRIMTVEKETLDLRQAHMHSAGERKQQSEVIPEPVRLVADERETNESNTLANLSRYEARYNRQLRNATAEQGRAQNDRPASEAENTILQNEGNGTSKSGPKPLELVHPDPNHDRPASEAKYTILQNEGNGSPKSGPKPLKLVRPDPKSATQPKLTAPGDK